MEATTSSGSTVHPRRPTSSSSSTEGKARNFDEEQYQDTAGEVPGQSLRDMFSTTASSANETKRAMQSHHLMMIGEFPWASIILLVVLIGNMFSYWWNNRHGHLFECWIGECSSFSSLPLYSRLCPS